MVYVVNTDSVPDVVVYGDASEPSDGSWLSLPANSEGFLANGPETPPTMVQLRSADCELLQTLAVGNDEVLVTIASGEATATDGIDSSGVSGTDLFTSDCR